MKTAALLVIAAALHAQPKLDLPLSMVLSPDAKFVLVLDSGGSPALSVRAATTPDQEVAHLAMPGAWLGLTFAPDKKTIYVGGGSRGSVFEIAFSPEGALALKREMKASDFVGDVALSPDGRLIYAADVFTNVIAVINPQSGRVIDRFKTGRRPYRIVFHPDGKSYFVSSWADAAVYQYNTVNGEEIGRIRLGSHTTDMVLSAYKPQLDDGEPPPEWKYRLFVAAANTNSIYSVGIGENKTMNVLEQISVAPEPLSPLGMTPSALALSPDHKELFVACSDADAVAVIDVSGRNGELEGFLAAGAYPTALAARAIEKTVSDVLIANRSTIISAPASEAAPLKGEEPPAPLFPSEHVLYIVPQNNPAIFMRAIGGLAPDFTIKLGREPKFDLNDPANIPPTGYIWTQVLAAGKTVQNYGVFVRNGQAMDPALRPFTQPTAQTFLDDLKEGEASNEMPSLILINAGDPARQSIVDAVMKSRFGASTKVIENGDASSALQLLGLNPGVRTKRQPGAIPR